MVGCRVVYGGMLGCLWRAARLIFNFSSLSTFKVLAILIHRLLLVP